MDFDTKLFLVILKAEPFTIEKSVRVQPTITIWEIYRVKEKPIISVVAKFYSGRRGFATDDLFVSLQGFVRRRQNFNLEPITATVDTKKFPAPGTPGRHKSKLEIHVTQAFWDIKMLLNFRSVKFTKLKISTAGSIDVVFYCFFQPSLVSISLLEAYPLCTKMGRLAVTIWKGIGKHQCGGNFSTDQFDASADLSAAIKKYAVKNKV